MIAANLNIRVVENSRGTLSIERKLSGVRFGKNPTEREYQALVETFARAMLAVRKGEARIKAHAQASSTAQKPVHARGMTP